MGELQFDSRHVQETNPTSQFDLKVQITRHALSIASALLFLKRSEQVFEVDDAPVPYKNASTIEFSDGIHTCHKRRHCERNTCHCVTSILFIALVGCNTFSVPACHRVPFRFQTTNMTFHTGEPCDPRLESFFILSGQPSLRGIHRVQNMKDT